MHLLLLLPLALLPESLAMRFEPARAELVRAESLIESDLPDSARAAVERAARLWSEVGTLADSSPGIEGWNEGVEAAAGRFAALAATARPKESDVAALADVLYWLPRAKPALLKFAGYKCEKCVAMEQVLDKVRADYAGRAIVRAVDVNKDEASARKHRVTVVPTMVFLDERGKEVARVAREMTEAELRSRLDLLLMHR